MRMTLPMLLTLGCLATLPAQRRMNASGGVLRADQACFDVRHYTLRIGVDPAEKSIAGQLTMRAEAVAEVARLSLDLENRLQVAVVNVDGKRVPFEHEGGRIAIEPAAPIATGQLFEVEVVYSGKPRVAPRPPWSGGFTWSKTADGKPWIATTCQGEGADLWWPCKDHPSDKPDGFDLHCTVPDGLIVASNGTLQGEPKLADGKRTFHWRSASPIANYNIALNIAPYVELKSTFQCIDGTEMPISFYVLPKSVRAAKRCMPFFLDHMAVFEEMIGPYPFRHEKYGIAETPHLGMEHQTIIAYGNGFNEPQWDWLHHHELSHEWWGNLITCRDWKDMWLHEGFGTYMQPLYREKRFGYPAYLAELRQRRTLNRVPMAPREVKDSKQIYFAGNNNDIYYKGSWVLHTLRYLIGDEKFFEVLRRFAYPNDEARAATDGSQVRFVDTQEFVDLCSKIAGQDLGWFFEVYVRSAGLPQLEYALVDGVLELAWKTPDDLPFPMPVAVTVSATEQRVEMPDGKARIEVGDSEFKIDPLDRVLMAKPRKRQ